MKMQNKKFLKFGQIFVVITFLGLPSVLFAHGDEAHTNTINKEGNYMKNISLNGTELIFHIEPNNISLTILDKKSKEKIKDAIVKLKVIAPDQSIEIQKLELKNDYYENSFSMKQKGLYKVVALFKISGKKKKVGFQFKLD